MKKVQEYCEVIQPATLIENITQHLFASEAFNGVKTIVLLGTDSNRRLQLMQDNEGKPLYFDCAIDAVNYLSKSEGWHLVKTFSSALGTTESPMHEHWIMAREVEVDE